ncbi:TetR/AcrR family transcriptional regulator [Ramlibacter sp. PS4R-6]|uniref:TetR/AcrR family transcriptional regulator n=1 Tax=Ramlibacter sp. PS4R-6 TaxID=3133438 RepID=UPI0030B072CF
MAPRAYNSETRKQQQAALKARIAEAAVQLHAEKGVLGTSYADVAQRAGVSLPTVYNHFPTQDDLIGACTGHAASLAPELPVGDMLAAPTLAAAAEMLADAMDRMHLYFEPWMAWGERRVIPTLQQILDGERRQLTGLIAQLLAAHLGAGDHREAAATWETLLSFDFWHRLVREHKLARTAARRQVVQLLLAAAGPLPAASPSPRPKHRK